MMTYWRRNPALKFKRNDPDKPWYLIRENASTGDAWGYTRTTSRHGVMASRPWIASRPDIPLTWLPITRRQFYRKLGRIQKKGLGWQTLQMDISKVLQDSVLSAAGKEIMDRINSAVITVGPGVLENSVNVEIALPVVRLPEHIELNFVV